MWKNLTGGFRNTSITKSKTQWVGVFVLFKWYAVVSAVVGYSWNAIRFNCWNRSCCKKNYAAKYIVADRMRVPDVLFCIHVKILSSIVRKNGTDLKSVFRVKYTYDRWERKFIEWRKNTTIGVFFNQKDWISSFKVKFSGAESVSSASIRWRAYRWLAPAIPLWDTQIPAPVIDQITVCRLIEGLVQTRFQ